MKTKVIFIDKANKETIVATFKTLNEASCCRDFLQAKCSDQDNCYYYTEFKGTRRAADTFARQIQYLNKDVQENIRLMLK